MNQSIIFQRVEGLVIFAASLYFYIYLDFNLILFAVLLLSIDIFMIGYLFGSKAGSYLYNLGHSMILPSLVLVVGTITDTRVAVGFSLIWLAHIGLDRAIGYGLKLSTDFKDTHLGRIGGNNKKKQK